MRFLLLTQYYKDGTLLISGPSLVERERGAVDGVRVWGIVLALSLFLATAISSENTLAQSENTAPLIFELETSARVAGLGGAFLALSDDESAAYYNPAGLAFVSTRGVAALYSQLFGVVDYLAVGGVFASVGFQVIRLDTSDMPENNAFGNPTDQNADYVSQAGVAAAALALGKQLSLGGRVKVYQTSSGDWNGFGWAGDAAILFRWAGFSVGAVMENLVQQAIKYNQGPDQAWPRDLRVGGAYSLDFRPLQVILLIDETHLLTQKMHTHIGLEAWVHGIGLRLGYNGLSITAGASAYFKNFRLDWAYAIHPQLPTSYVMTVTYRF
ncbi:hypothetical protein HYR54_03795 [Candidatus Acetothermia bacterium]|nr:hypothetical protein [Candidatus Acetothermia bacterium]MBI3659334.1 hypothetical protein [Candidatus Acetothermia bacterium]